MHINANKICQFLFQIVGCDRFSNNENNNRVFGPYKQRKVLKTKRKTIMDTQYSMCAWCTGSWVLTVRTVS